MNIYLDHNIFISLSNLKKENLQAYTSLINELKIKNTFYYSYGHLEEINYIANQDQKKFNFLFNVIEEITENNEIIFDSDNFKYIFIKEPIENCYSRVSSSTEYNNVADENFKKRHEDDESFNSELNGKLINNIKDKKFFYKYKNEFQNFMIRNLKESIESSKTKEIEYLTNFFNAKDNSSRINFYRLYKIEQNSELKKLRNKCIDLFSDINNINFNVEFDKAVKNNSKTFEMIIELIFKFLYQNNYFKEKTKLTTYRSKIFDVTHTIFGSKTDYFITSDKKLYHKVVIIFDFLNIDTNIILVNDTSLIEELNKLK